MRLSLTSLFAKDESKRKNSVSLNIAENSSKDVNGNRKAKELDLKGAADTGTGSSNPY